MRGGFRSSRIRRDAAALVRSDETLARAAEAGGRFEVPLRPPGFATLIWLILGQQVSIEAADAMFGGLEATLGGVTPDGLLGLGDETLRRCGFSRQKAGYARDLARALLSGDVSLEQVEALPDAAAVAAVSGRTVVAAGPPWATSVFASQQGLRKDGSPVLAERSIALKGLVSDYTGGAVTFFSLGFAGWTSSACRTLRVS